MMSDSSFRSVGVEFGSRSFVDLVVRSHVLPEAKVYRHVTPILWQTAAGIVLTKLAGHRRRDGWMYSGATSGLSTPAGDRRAHSRPSARGQGQR